MAAKSTTPATSKARSRSKTKPTTTSPKIASNILFFDKKRSEEPAKNSVKDYLERLSDEHHDVICDYLDVLWGRNTRTDDTSPSGQVIPFAVVNKRLSAKEAQ